MVSVAMEEYELMKDAKYRLYVSAVDKALKSFESTSEWPDLIASLGKLNKVIKEHQRFPVIPRRIKISKRLAQCMHYGLPSGVHLRALEVYDTIFKCMGTNRLSHELFIYSAGLFPLLGNSAITVKPPLLTIYETHFVPLAERLLPGLSGFLSGVLPGVEEGSDHFERTNSLLEKVCQGVGPAAFYGCLWEGVAGNAAVRLPAVNFVLSHFNKKMCMEDQLYVMGTNVDLMVKALCAGVQDSNVLVQRSSLDLLLVGFPIHNSQLLTQDMILLMTASLTTILRRDMSLNRRLCGWILGSEVDVNALPHDHPFRRKIEEEKERSSSAIYFEMYSRDLVVQGVKATLRQGGSDIRSYRLLTSLLDKVDIGPVILDDILFDVFRLLYSACKMEDKLESPKRKVEVLKSANLFFNSIDLSVVWQFLESMFEQASIALKEKTNEPESCDPIVKEVGAGNPSFDEICVITDFLLDVIPIEINLDSSSEQLMNFIVRLIDLLTNYLDVLSPNLIAQSLNVILHIFKKLNLSRLKVKSELPSDSELDKPGELIRPSVIRSMIGRNVSASEPSVPTADVPATSTPKQAAEATEIVQSFLNDFQKFFVLLAGNKRILNSPCIRNAFNLLKKPAVRKNEKRNDYAFELRRLLNSVVTDKKEGSENVTNSGGNDLKALELTVPGNDRWTDCFEVATLILVEASSITFCIQSSFANLAQTPSWLETLLVCCCYLKESPRLQITAIRTLLDLLKLLEISEDHEEASVKTIASELAQFHANTTIFKVITETLWNHLGHLGSDLQVLCIQLLHQLDNILLSDDCVERILGEILLKGDEAIRVDSLMRFINLWTVGRELQDGRQKRCFQSCLLKILDNLLLPDNSPLKLLTEAWLGQALMRGDITRLLDPLLVILLDPATARMGILHVSIQHPVPDVAPEDVVSEDTSKIYAISSVDGNVIYHVSDDSVRKHLLQKRLKWRWKKNETTAEQRVYAVTSLKSNTDSQLRYITEKNVSRDIELPRPSNSHVSLFVNPFNAGDDDDSPTNSEQPLSELIKSARRITKLGDAAETTMPRVTLELSTAPENRSLDAKYHVNKFSDNDGEETLSANEYFGDSLSRTIALEMLDTMIETAIRKSEARGELRGIGVHPLHSHLLLYCGVYDSTRTLYAFKTLKNALFTNPRLFLCCTATSGIVNASFPSELLVLLARHRKSVYGRSFDGAINSLSEYVTTYRSSMYLEVIVSVCLYFSRSFYPNLGLPKLTSDVLEGNRLVQLTSIEMLTHVFTELLPIVRDSGKGFARYIADMLTRCKVQKIVLHCLMSCLSSVPRQQNIHYSRTFTDEIIEFNDSVDQNALSEHSRTLQIQLLKLVLALIKLEHGVEAHRAESPDVSNHSKDGGGSNHDANYNIGFLIPQQPLFLRAIISALTLKGSMRMLHSHWTDMVTASLPYLGSALPHIVMVVVNQLCIIIEELSTIYASSVSCEELPPDYAVTQLEALMFLCHYCVLDSTQQVSPLYLSSCNAANSSGFQGPNPAQILNNLVHVFTPMPLIQRYPHLIDRLLGADDLNKDKNQQLEAMLAVRRSMLGKMPRIIASLSSLWTVVAEKPTLDEITIWGSLRVVRSQILEFLSPISLHHGACFLAAIAIAWQERKSCNPKQVLPHPTKEQDVLVHLVSSIKVMPIDTFVQTVHLVLKQPPAVEETLPDTCLEVSVLELFYVYMQSASGNQLRECWGSLLALLRDGLLLSPPAIFLVLAILNEFVQRAPAFQDKKDQRELQDITAKLVEACGAVAGACLEQTTWLRRNLAVKDLDSIDDESSLVPGSSVQQHSYQAQLVLAQILAPLLDVSYGSQEKEKVANILIALMYNITPYLKNHQARYASSFQACSQLLASLSGFPYTRKAWKKDAFELLLEPTLFQMDSECLPYWTTIVDNLMTHDQTTFRDLMSRISVAQSGSYNLFSSREQEYEQRAQLLKRLAFVIMSSEMDQYSKLMNSIQERLTESLKLPQVVPSIQAQVFFCFRVLLLRMSPHHVTSLWPIVISEMVQVFMHIEQELTTDTEEFSSHIKTMSALDSSWVVNSSNGLNAHGHPHWLLLTLAASKLLDLVVLLPANHLPQFQMYRWAFVGDSNFHRKGDQAVGHQGFVPHILRISKLMDEKFGPCEVYLRPKEGQLLLTSNSITSLQQLHSFFHCLQFRPKSANVDLPSVEESVRMDFLDKMATTPVP